MMMMKKAAIMERKESDTQALLAAELNRLSVKERDEVLLDIHGCSANNMMVTSSSRGKRNGKTSSNNDKEEEEEVDGEEEDEDGAIRRFLEHLQTIPDEEKRAYLLAVEQDKSKNKNDSACGKSEKTLSSSSATAGPGLAQSYVHDPDFILMFLRADRFNVAYAVRRFVMFFEQKLTLFGPEKLARDIWWSDLSDDDKSWLESGYVQLLPRRDRAGRAVIWLAPTVDSHREQHRDSSAADNMCRALYMVYMFALKDVQTQKNGFVACSYLIGDTKGSISYREPGIILKTSRLVSALPVQILAIHHGYDDAMLRMTLGIALPALPESVRLRCRMHYGSCQEFKYALMSFGIPEYIMPVTSSGEYRLENHKDFVRTIRWADRERLAKTGNDQGRDGTQVAVERVVLPNNIDVLLGRGRPLQKHYGNQNYHFLVEEYQPEYERSSKSKKTTMTKTILDRIRQYGGRFLKEDDVGYWIEIDDDSARSKISQTFRNHRCATRKSLKKMKRAVEGAEGAVAPVAAAASVNNVDMSPVLDRSLAGTGRRELSHNVAPTSTVGWNTSSYPSWVSHIGSSFASTSGTETSNNTDDGTCYSHRHHQHQLFPQQQQPDQQQHDPFHSVVDDMLSRQKRRRFDNNNNDEDDDFDFDLDFSSSPSSTTKMR